jgi:hypothetical protein
VPLQVVSSVKAAQQRSVSLATFQTNWDPAQVQHLEKFSFIAAPSMEDGVFHFASTVWKEISSDSTPPKAFWVGRIVSLFPNSPRKMLQPGFIYYERDWDLLACEFPALFQEQKQCFLQRRTLPAQRRTLAKKHQKNVKLLTLVLKR